MTSLSSVVEATAQPCWSEGYSVTTCTIHRHDEFYSSVKASMPTCESSTKKKSRGCFTNDSDALQGRFRLCLLQQSARIAAIGFAVFLQYQVKASSAFCSMLFQDLDGLLTGFASCDLHTESLLGTSPENCWLWNSRI